METTNYNIIYINSKITYIKYINKLASLYNNGRYNGNELFVLSKFVGVLQDAISREIENPEFTDHSDLIDTILNFDTTDTSDVIENIRVEDSEVNLDDFKNTLVETIHNVSEKYGNRQKNYLTNIKTNIDVELIKESDANKTFINEESRLKELIDNTENIDPEYLEKYQALTPKYKISSKLDSVKSNIISVLQNGTVERNDSSENPDEILNYIIKVFNPLASGIDKLIKEISINYSEIIGNAEYFEAYNIYSSVANAFANTWNDYNPDDDKIYMFTSYGDAGGESIYAEGKVKATGESTGDLVEVKVIENSIEGFTGNKYWIDKNATEGDTLYQLKDENCNDLGLWVKITGSQNDGKTKQDKLLEMLENSNDYQNASDNVKNIINDIFNKTFDEDYKYTDENKNIISLNANELNNIYNDIVANNAEKNSQIEQKKEELAVLNEQFNKKYNKDYTPKQPIDETTGTKSTDEALEKINNINTELSASDQEIPVESIELDQTSITLTIGETNEQQLTATILPENATDKTVNWISNNPEIATVENGIVRGISAGETDIIVKANDNENIIATCHVIVNGGNVSVDGIELNISEITINRGEPQQLTATVLPENATNKNVTWSSSDESIATVDENGLVTVLAHGTATITVTTEDGGFTDICNISAVVPVESITLDKTDEEINIDDELQLTATILPEDHSPITLTWSSGDESVATVDDNGLVHGISAGETTITVEAGNVTATCNIKVKEQILFYIGKDDSLITRTENEDTGDVTYDFDITSPLIQKLDSTDDIFTTWDLLTDENKYIYMIADDSVSNFEIWDEPHENPIAYKIKATKQYNSKTYNLYRSGLTSETSVSIERV